jgi:hypothetical protein
VDTYGHKVADLAVSPCSLLVPVIRLISSGPECRINPVMTRGWLTKRLVRARADTWRKGWLRRFIRKPVRKLS